MFNLNLHCCVMCIWSMLRVHNHFQSIEEEVAVEPNNNLGERDLRIAEIICSGKLSLYNTRTIIQVEYTWIVFYSFGFQHTVAQTHDVNWDRQQRKRLPIPEYQLWLLRYVHVLVKYFILHTPYCCRHDRVRTRSVALAMLFKSTGTSRARDSRSVRLVRLLSLFLGFDAPRSYLQQHFGLQ